MQPQVRALNNEKLSLTLQLATSAQEKTARRSTCRLTTFAPRTAAPFHDANSRPVSDPLRCSQLTHPSVFTVSTVTYRYLPLPTVTYRYLPLRPVSVPLGCLQGAQGREAAMELEMEKLRGERDAYARQLAGGEAAEGGVLPAVPSEEGQAQLHALQTQVTAA